MRPHRIDSGDLLEVSEPPSGVSNARRIRAGRTPATSPAGIIAAMTERGLPSADGSPACPFVAFEDERDERADRPDHRHRCYAVSEPAPRALAHQEAYCLSSAFPVCPVFQEWARREAAHARSGGTPTPTPPARRSRPARRRALRPIPPPTPTGTRSPTPARTDPPRTTGSDDATSARSRSGRVGIRRATGRPRRRGPPELPEPPGPRAGPPPVARAGARPGRPAGRPTTWPRARSRDADSPAVPPIDSPGAPKSRIWMTVPCRVVGPAAGQARRSSRH